MNEIHDRIRSLIAAYALGSVPEDEIPAIRAHILSCEECFEETESFAAVSMTLTEVVEPVELPNGFAERVLAEIHEETARKDEPKRNWASISAKRLLLAGAVTIVIALLALTTSSYLGSLSRQREYQRVIAALIHDPNAFSLTGPGGAEAVLASTAEGSVLVAVDLGEAPAGRDYQLWLMEDGTPVPAETFDVSDSVVIVELSREISGFDGAAVTVEPEGGSEQPTTEPVLASG